MNSTTDVTSGNMKPICWTKAQITGPKCENQEILENNKAMQGVKMRNKAGHAMLSNMH